MDQLTYTLTAQHLNVLNSENADLTGFLNRFFAPGSNTYQQLTYELQREFKQGGSPEVTHITIDRVKYDAATAKGSFRVVLDINFTFGCEDVKTEKEGQTSEWTFVVNHPDKTITFYSSPYAESRSTADEF